MGAFITLIVFSIEHRFGENKIELLDDYYYLVSDEEWHDYEQEIKTPLPQDLSNLCSSRETSAIALESFKHLEPDSDYQITSLELNILEPTIDLQLDSAPEKELVWRVNGYKLTEDDDYFFKQ